MNQKLSEEEMRRALFGNAEIPSSIIAHAEPDPVPDIVILPAAKSPAKKKVSKALTPRIRVTLRVGNEFEGETSEIIHEADTLSTLLAEQEAVKAAKKKYRYIEVVSVKSM